MEISHKQSRAEAFKSLRKTSRFTQSFAVVIAIALMALVANCSGSDSDGDGSTDTESADNGGSSSTAVYEFASRFEDGSSVAYGGQTHRQVLISDLTSYINGLTESLDSGDLVPEAGDVRGAIDFYYEYDDATSSRLRFWATWHGFNG